MAKKNPIKKRVQGSQKPNPMPAGDPSKYMGDAEWEQYNEPQGINSPAAKRVMKTEAIRRVVNQILGTVANVQENPTKAQMEAMLQRFIDLDGIADEHGNLYLWSVDAAEHADVARELGIDPARSVFFVYGLTDPERVVYLSAYGMKHRDLELVDRILKTNQGYLRVFANDPVDTSEVQKWGMMRGDWAKKLDQEREQRAAAYEDFSNQVDEEMGPLGGFMAPLRGGDSKFAIPDNMAVIDPESFEFSSLAQSKKDAKKVRKQVNKNIQKQQDNPNFEDELNEMIRLPIFSLISGQYEVKEGENTVGYAHVKDGVIAELTCQSGANEEYRGQILTHLLNTIIDEADLQNSNLSLQLQDKDADDMKRFLERFGFKHVGHGVMQRTAGSVRPPSVQYSNGQEGP